MKLIFKGLQFPSRFELEMSNEDAIINRLGSIISIMLDKVADLYLENNFMLSLAREYAFQVVFALLAPVQLQPIPFEESEIVARIQDKQQENEEFDIVKEQAKIMKRYTPKQGSLRAMFMEEEQKLKEWIIQRSVEEKHNPSKAQVQWKAKELTSDPYFKASDGWFHNFIKRHEIVKGHISNYVGRENCENKMRKK